MWAFGDGDFGKLGQGNTVGKHLPTKIKALQGHVIKKVACGTQFSVALSKYGKVFTWGQGTQKCLLVLESFKLFCACMDIL